MRRLTLSPIIVALGFFGCSTTQRAEQPAPAPQPTTAVDPVHHNGLESPWIFVTPSDLMTSIATTVPRVVIRGLPENDLPRATTVESFVGLYTWPELTPVAGAMKTTKSDASDYAIEFSTPTALPDRWYAVRISSVPSGFKMGGGVHAKQLQDGTWVVRFRPGSEPVVRTIQYCAKKDGKHSLMIDLSESVKAPAGMEPIVVTNAMGAKLSCATANNYAEPVQALHVSCDSVADSITVSFATLAATASAKTIVDKHTFRISDLPKNDGECRLFVP